MIVEENLISNDAGGAILYLGDPLVEVSSDGNLGEVLPLKAYFGDHKRQINSTREGVEIFPNPSNGYVNIILNPNYSSEVQIRFFGIDGRMIFDRKLYLINNGPKYFHLNTTGISTGSYYLSVNQANWTDSFKVQIIK